MNTTSLLALICLVGTLTIDTHRVSAQTMRPIRIGVLTDMSGPASSFSGEGSVIAARLGAEDFKGTIIGRPIEILSGDTQNKPDVASLIARRWFDEGGVGAIADLPNSGVALAVVAVAINSQRFAMVANASLADVTMRLCSPYSSHWTDDTWTLSRAVGRLGIANIGKTWFFVVLDNVFGKAIASDTSEVLKGLGGDVAGIVRHPLGADDMSSFVLQAIASKASVIAVGNVGSDLVNFVKQASEFGLQNAGAKIVTFFTTVADVDAIGLNSAQGLYAVENFYWDQNDATRAFAKRFEGRSGKMPTKQQAAVYASVVHYLKSIEASATDDPEAVATQFHARPAEFFGQRATVRADGRVLLDVNLYQVIRPQESKGRWDLYRLVATLPALQAYNEITPQCSATH